MLIFSLNYSAFAVTRGSRKLKHENEARLLFWTLTQEEEVSNSFNKAILKILLTVLQFTQ